MGFAEKSNMKTKSAPNGFSIVEICVAMVMLSFLLSSMTSLMINQGKNVKNIETKFDVMDLKQRVALILSNKSNCELALRENATNGILFNPPADFNVAYNVPVVNMYHGNELQFGVNQSFEGVEITSMRLVRITGLPRGEYDFPSVKTATITPSWTYVTRLEVQARNRAGTFAGETRTFNQNVNVYVSKATNRMVSCSGSEKYVVQRAIANRTGAMLSLTDCETDPNPQKYMANPTCTDVNNNNSCDGLNAVTPTDPYGDMAGSLVKPAHPEYADMSKPASYFRVGPSATLGPEQSEGRCPVKIWHNTSAEDAKQIFKIYHRPKVGPIASADGLGCNTANGWHLASCTRSDLGVADTDFYVGIEAGNEYCATNDWTQPHRGLGIWNATSLTLSVVCLKFD